MEDLLEASEAVVSETPDIDWYVTKLPSGSWGAWDDVSDEYPVFESRSEAVQFQCDGFEAAELPNEAWIA